MVSVETQTSLTMLFQSSNSHRLNVRPRDNVKQPRTRKYLRSVEVKSACGNQKTTNKRRAQYADDRKHADDVQIYVHIYGAYIYNIYADTCINDICRLYTHIIYAGDICR